VDAHGFARHVGLGEDPLQQRRAEAAAAVLREQCDVDDADLLRPARQVEPADGDTLPQDQLEVGAGVVLLIVGVLRGELLPQEGVLLLAAPRHRR
jgi:hypothetical protein